MRLKDVSRVILDQRIVTKTLEVLQAYGKRQFEGLVLWVGSISENEAKIEDVWVPPQRSIREERGVGYFVSSDALVEISRKLREKGVRLIAQVHSHPGRAYHSEADDAYAIVTTNGGFSLVVPNFGFCPEKITNWAVYRLNGANWIIMTTQEIDQVFSAGQKNSPPRPGSFSFFA